MKTENSVKEVVNIWGLITLFLAKLVAPLPTANRWLSKKGESTNNLLSYGLTNLRSHRLNASLSIATLA